MARSDKSSPGYFLAQTLTILALIEAGHGDNSASTLGAKVEISLATFKRYLVRAESDLGVVVQWDESIGYKITDWGIINKEALMARYNGGGFAAVIKS